MKNSLGGWKLTILLLVLLLSNLAQFQEKDDFICQCVEKRTAAIIRFTHLEKDVGGVTLSDEDSKQVTAHLSTGAMASWTIIAEPDPAIVKTTIAPNPSMGTITTIGIVGVPSFDFKEEKKTSLKVQAVNEAGSTFGRRLSIIGRPTKLFVNTPLIRVDFDSQVNAKVVNQIDEERVWNFRSTQTMGMDRVSMVLQKFAPKVEPVACDGVLIIVPPDQTTCAGKSTGFKVEFLEASFNEALAKGEIPCRESQGKCMSDGLVFTITAERDQRVLPPRTVRVKFLYDPPPS